MSPLADSTIELVLELPPPIDLPASLGPLGRWGDDGLDRWDGNTLVRTLRTDRDRIVPYVALAGGDLWHPTLNLRLPQTADRAPSEVEAAITATFLRWPQAVADLAAMDRHVRRLVDLYPGIVPVLFTDPFTALVRSISAQQVNLRWATTVRRRLAERYGLRHDLAGTVVYSLHPAPIAAESVHDLRLLQLTNAKARSLLGVARAALDGELDRAQLAAMEDGPLIDHLTRLPGIGRWSAEWFLARTLGRPRVVAGDLGVRKAVGRLYGLGSLPSEDEVRHLTSHWGDAATIAQALALHDLAVAAGVA